MVETKIDSENIGYVMFYFNKLNLKMNFTFVISSTIMDFSRIVRNNWCFHLPFSCIPHCSFQKTIVGLSPVVVGKQNCIDRIEIYVKTRISNCSVRTIRAKKVYKKHKLADGTIKTNIYTKSKYMYQYMYKIILKKVLTTIGYDRRPLPHTGRVAIYRNPIPYSQILAPNISPYYKHHTRYYGIESVVKIYAPNHYTKIRIGNVCTKTEVRNDI